MSILTALVIAALGIGLFVAFQKDMHAHQQRISTGSRVLDCRCGPIEFAEAGSGTPLLMIDGTGGGFDQGMLAGQDFVNRGGG